MFTSPDKETADLIAQDLYPYECITCSCGCGRCVTCGGCKFSQPNTQKKAPPQAHKPDYCRRATKCVWRSDFKKALRRQDKGAIDEQLLEDL